MNLVAVLVAPICIMEISNTVRTTIVVIAALLLAGAILFSKRSGGSYGSTEPAAKPVR